MTDTPRKITVTVRDANDEVIYTTWQDEDPEHPWQIALLYLDYEQHTKDAGWIGLSFWDGPRDDRIEQWIALQLERGGVRRWQP